MFVWGYKMMQTDLSNCWALPQSAKPDPEILHPDTHPQN